MDSNHEPVPHGTTSFWRTQPHALDNHRSSESLPRESDIVVIGAGYAGASVVHHLLSHADPASVPSILVLESRQACSGATGRNGIEHGEADIIVVTLN
jgi:lysine/ornithine N-monooxygenase